MVIFFILFTENYEPFVTINCMPGVRDFILGWGEMEGQWIGYDRTDKCADIKGALHNFMGR